MRFLPPPSNVPDKPLGPQRGGVLSAPWVARDYRDRGYPTMPTNAPMARGVPPSRHLTPMAWAPLSADGLGASPNPYITRPIGPAPQWPIRDARTRSTQPRPHVPQWQGIFRSFWLPPSIHAAVTEDLQTETPEWVQMQERARVITGPPPVGAVPYPGQLVEDTVFGRRR